MTRLLAALVAVICLTSFVATSRAQDKAPPPVTLKVGDAAPPLAGGKWVKGDPITILDPGKTYVVEFWATWCGPCRQSIPHLSEMAKQYSDVTFIGQDVWEQDQAAVEPFVKEMGDKKEYHVRMDDLSGGTDANAGKMAVTWMQAAGRNSIPSAFVVGKDGKIAWIGHPMEMEPVLKRVVAGNFNAKKYADEQGKVEQVGKALNSAMQNKDYDTALAKVDELAKVAPQFSEQLDATRFQILMSKKDYDSAYKVAGQIADKQKDNAGVQNEIAWMIVDEQGITKRDLPLAEKLATQAVAASKGEDGQILDTLARVYFEKGEMKKAVDTETKAVDKAEEGQMKTDLKATLEKYQKAAADKPA